MANRPGPNLASGYKENLKYDLPAGLVVFLVALPLCLGIALASGAPLFSGVISGVIGGIIVGRFSGSEISVSGPAAGLAVIVASAIVNLGSYEIFLTAVVIAGIIQLMLGYAKAGVIGNYFPASVIEGMLAAIGIVIFLKQFPHAVGWDSDYEGDMSFRSGDGNTFSNLFDALGAIEPAALIISIVSLSILIIWENNAVKNQPFLKSLPAPLLVVVIGVMLNLLFKEFFTGFELNSQNGHLVSLPVASTPLDFLSFFRFPDFSALLSKQTYIAAITIAVVASLETLLSVEAGDKIDPFKRISDTNQELKAQGIGNFISGLIGGLPITAVIVRTSANAYSGARTRNSSIFHGFLLFVSVAFVPHLLNMIPLASLACILLMIGYKLAKLQLFLKMFKSGKEVFTPFIVTIVSVVFTDLLIGIAIGSLVGLFFVIRANHHSAVIVVNEGDHYLLKFNKDISFVNKSELKEALRRIPDNCFLCIDGTRSMFIDNDILDVVSDFKEAAVFREIEVELKNLHTKDLPMFNLRKSSNAALKK